MNETLDPALLVHADSSVDTYFSTVSVFNPRRPVEDADDLVCEPVDVSRVGDILKRSRVKVVALVEPANLYPLETERYERIEIEPFAGEACPPPWQLAQLSIGIVPLRLLNGGEGPAPVRPAAFGTARTSPPPGSHNQRVADRSRSQRG